MSKPYLVNSFYDNDNHDGEEYKSWGGYTGLETYEVEQ